MENSGVAANCRESPRIHAVSPPFKGTSKSWGNAVVLLEYNFHYVINRAAATLCQRVVGGAGFGSLAGRECSAFSSKLTFPSRIFFAVD